MTENLLIDKSILIVDDNTSNLRLLRNVLVNRGYKIRVANNGATAMDSITAELPELILMDVKMPDMDGFEVCQKLKKHPSFREIPVIFISAAKEPFDKLMAFSVGGVDYITKPFEPEEVAARVKTHLTISQLQKEYIQINQFLEDKVRERTIELNKLYKELAIKEKRYRTIFNTVPIAIWEVDFSHLIKFLNSRQIDSLEKLNDLKNNTLDLETQLLKKIIFRDSNPEGMYLLETKSIRENLEYLSRNLIFHEDRQFAKDFILHIIKKKKLFSRETRIVTKKNNIKDILLTVFFPKDKTLYNSILICVVDISEIKELESQTKKQEERLYQMEKLSTLGTLVSGVAHEINNPNNFIYLNIKTLHSIMRNIFDLLQEKELEYPDLLIGTVSCQEACEDVNKLLNGIQEGSERISRIVQTLKDYVKPGTERFEKLNLIQVLNKAIELLSNQIKKSTNHFQLIINQPIPNIIGNKQKIEQVFINIIHNSCQALQNKDQAIIITINYNQTLDVIRVSVEDEGIGINSEELKYIFDPFFTTKREQGGTGLGLSIAQKIINEHSGKMEITSNAGKGTQTSIVLPVNQKKGSY